MTRLIASTGAAIVIAVVLAALVLIFGGRNVNTLVAFAVLAVLMFMAGWVAIGLDRRLRRGSDVYTS